jgi:hypothetical protein
MTNRLRVDHFMTCLFSSTHCRIAPTSIALQYIITALARSACTAASGKVECRPSRLMQEDRPWMYVPP